MSALLKPFALTDAAAPENYSNIDPLDGRYFDAEISKYLSEQARITYQAYVEAALAHTLAEFGLCDQKAADEIEKAARQITAAEVYEEEKTTKHDVKALLNCIKRDAGEGAYDRAIAKERRIVVTDPAHREAGFGDAATEGNAGGNLGGNDSARKGGAVEGDREVGR